MPPAQKKTCLLNQWSQNLTQVEGCGSTQGVIIAMWLAPCSLLLAFSTWLLAYNSHLLTPCSLLLAPCSWLLEYGSLLLAPGSWLLASVTSWERLTQGTLITSDISALSVTETKHGEGHSTHTKLKAQCATYLDLNAPPIQGSVRHTYKV